MKQQIVSQLSLLKDDLNKLNDNYYIIGSGGLILLDIEVGETGDIDILVSKRDAESLKLLWKDYRELGPLKKDDELFMSDFVRYNFELIPIEIMGELHINVNGIFEKLIVKDSVTVKLDTDFVVRIPTLEDYKRILTLFGREKDLAKLQIILNLERH